MNDATLSQVDSLPAQRGSDVAPVGPPGFDLIDEVGRGGMGVVWRASDRAMQREVAVKLLLDKYAPDSGTARRFVAEAQITAQLQHPGIPAVYQVGTLADGRPFLAMKLIKGRTLAELLDAGSPVDPLAVVEAIGQAVGYAHAHGVIHRDLKPANVMVGAFGEVQVMDWGLAKVLAARRDRGRPEADPEATAAPTEINSARDAETPFTQYGSVLGTPAFMPPEQAAGELDKVDARSDVFGLGAILCVLLTGKPPVDGTVAEDVRINAVRGKTEAAFARLDAGGADPGVIALCKRCLAFEPTDRPGTADEVAATVAALRRAADDRARQAERDKLSAEVRAAEQAKRRRAVQWAAGAVAAVLLLGVAGTTIGLIRADAARRDAEAARRATDAERTAAEEAWIEALAKEGEANAVVQFYERRVLVAARPKGQVGGLGKDVTLREAIVASLPALSKEFADQPLVEARVRLTLGNTFAHLGEYGVAVEQYERAGSLSAAHLGPDDPITLLSMNSLALGYAAQGRPADTVKLCEETLAARRRVLGPDHPDTLSSLHSLALGHAALGHSAAALELYEAVLAARRRVLGPDHPDTLMTMNNLANSYAEEGRPGDALKLCEETLAARKRALPPDHPETLASMQNLAICYAAQGRSAAARDLCEEVLAAQKRVLPADHPDTLKSMHTLAGSYAAQDRHADALKLGEAALAGQRRVLPPRHPDTLSTLWGVAACLVELRRGAEAVPLIDECVAGATGRAGDSAMVPAVLALRLRHFLRAGDPDGCRSTAAMWEKLDRSDADSLYKAACYRVIAADIYARRNRPAEATADADRAMAWLRKAVAAGYNDRARLEEDKALNVLRSRDDFRALMKSLPAPTTKP